MTLAVFISISGKKEKTVMGWIRSGLVNGASYSDGVYNISDLSRPPYMRASSKNAASIRKAIVVGCKRRMSVNARVFKGVSDYEFSVYVDQLVELGLIEKRVVDGTIYYFSTPKADDMTENQVYNAVKGLTEAAVIGAVGAATEKMMG